MKKIIILILMTFMSLSVVSALSINNTIPTEINQYEFDINSFASCNDFDNCNITFSRENTTLDLPFTLNFEYQNEFFSSATASVPFSITYLNDFFYVLSLGTDRVYRYNTDGSYTGFNFFVGSQEGSPYAITSDNTNLFVVGRANDRVYEFTPSGTYTGNNFGVSSQTGEPRGLYYKDNTFYLSDNTGDIYTYNSSGTYTGTSYDFTSLESEITSIGNDGTYFYIAGTNSDTIFILNDSLDYINVSLDVSLQDTDPRGLVFFNDSIYMNGNQNDRVYKYNTYSANSFYTFTYNGNQDYTIFASNSTNNINESGSLLVNPPVSFNFQFNSTNVENYSFGGRNDVSDFVTYNIYNDGLNLGNNALTFNKFGYILQDFNFTLTNTTNTNFTFNVTPAQINVNIYDRITESLITQNVDLQLIGNVGDTVNTSTGTAELNAIDGIAGDYQIIATSNGYETESVYFEYTNQENVSLDIYLLNSTDLSLGFITIEVKDTLSFFIEGAIVNLLEWKPSLSSFVTVGQCQTLSNGKCNLNIELNNKLYKFQATKDDTTAETTSIIIDETGQTIPVTLQDITLSATANSDNILSNMTETVDNLTNSSLIRLQWSTKDNTNARACISVYSNPGYSQQLISQNCTTSNSGVLFSNVAINNPETVKVEGSVQDSFNTYLIDSFTYEGTGSLSKALNDYNLDILIPIIFLFIGIAVGLLFGNLYIGLILGVILEWIATIIAGNVISVSVAVVVTFISGLIIWGAYKK